MKKILILSVATNKDTPLMYEVKGLGWNSSLFLYINMFPSNVEPRDIVGTTINYLEKDLARVGGKIIIADFEWSDEKTNTNVYSVEEKVNPIKTKIQNTAQNNKTEKKTSTKISNVKSKINDENEDDLESFEEDVEEGKVFFDWSNIDYDKVYSTVQETTSDFLNIKVNRKMQDMLAKSFESSSRAIYYGSAPKSRTFDANDLLMFSANGVEDFLNGKRESLKIKPPKQLTITAVLDEDELRKDFSPFFKETEMQQYLNEEITWAEFCKIVNKSIINKFDSIRGIARKSKEYEEDTGNKVLYVAYPFIHGNFNDKVIRTPFMYTPIEVEIKLGEYIFTRPSDQPIKINANLIHFIYSAESQVPTNLVTSVYKVSDVFNEYKKHGIIFTNQLNEFSKFKKINKDDWEGTGEVNTFSIHNNALIEIVLWSVEVFNDFAKILKTYESVSFPDGNLDAFANEALDYQLLPIQVDDNKNMIVSAALEDSTTIAGPPGTGKSEVIVSILAKSASEQFKNLVVSEKDAALSVLVSRLSKKYKLDNFVLKLNGEEMLSKKLFWDKIRANIELIKNAKFVHEMKMDFEPDKYIQFMEKYALFIEQLVDKNVISKGSESTEMSDFWDLCDELTEFSTKINKPDGRSIASWASYLISEAEKHRALFHQKIDFQKKYDQTKNLFDHFEENKKRLTDELNQLLTPPTCYLPKQHLKVDDIQIELSDKELFKQLSNKQYNFFNLGKNYKKNRSDIIRIKELVHEITSDFSDKTQGELKKSLTELDINIKKTIVELRNIENNIFKGKDIVEEYKILKNNESAIAKWENVEKIFYQFYDDAFCRPHELFSEFEKQILKNYREYKDYVRDSLMLSIKTKIQLDDTADGLYETFNKLVTFSKISSIKSMKRPGDIIKRYFNLISTMFPIMLSTPVQVSKYLPYDPDIFDYGIFDEASQMFLERAIPSIHRCKKVIIAGDEKQLSPSSWFKPNSELENEETDDLDLSLEDVALNEADSLLSWGNMRFRSHMLTRHYRSSNAKLIEYSNALFYESKLEAVDSPSAEPNPIELINVRGKKLNSGNEIEAIAVCDKALELIEVYDSIGIITMNASQQKLIIEMIEETKYKRLFNILNPVAGSREHKKIFIKNIENVQGDEADVVIFSIVYAANENERIMIPNSSILTPNRLNVAITRAKSKMVVINSFNSQELGPGSEGSARQLLFKWIKWLEDNANTKYKTVSDRVYSHDNMFRSPFEEEFYEMLIQKINPKYRILTNFQTNNYEIDVVIFDSEKEVYVGAIELDGASFHSSPEQRAMDYDKTEFLRDCGWNIIRVWSTPFWKDKNECVEKAIKHLNLN